MVQGIGEILQERGSRYGEFINQATIAQGIHRMVEMGMARTNKTAFDFAPDEREALNMIINKIARIVNGDPHYSDSWRDIAGYATLVADRLDNEENRAYEQAERRELVAGREIEANRLPDETSGICECHEEGSGTSTYRPDGCPPVQFLPVVK